MVGECRMPLNMNANTQFYSELTSLVLQNMVKNGVNKNYGKNNYKTPNTT